ncbi:hypothetical protein NP493_89g01015 [Ridgeia piscesae]|uniref:Oxysterol-binding protein n=1 Tax=Ridgeia piscesae TaxID=27915 RepID=A0AAD9P8P9_RIDPI|nr:hypothetical protein NP493_89g01015 [Ridgeia piscesae]
MESEQTDSLESKPPSGGNKRLYLKHGSREWQLLEGLRGEQKFETKPDKYEGQMMKRRKWPLKGWHKRWFVIEKGILTYAKSSSDIAKGRFHGTVDIGLSVLTYKKHGRRIDIDAEDLIYHLKVKNQVLFDTWVSKLWEHRLYRQHEIAFGTKETPKLTDVATPVDDFTPIASPVSPNLQFSDRGRGSIKLRAMDRIQNKVTVWLMDTQGIEQCNRDLAQVQEKLFEMGGLIEKLQTLPPCYMYANGDHLPRLSDLGTPASTRKDKSTKRQLSKTGKKEKKGVNRLSVPETQPSLPSSVHLSSSNPNLLSHELDWSHPSAMPTNDFLVSGHSARIQELKYRDDFLTSAKTVHEVLRSLQRTMTTERERLKHACEQHNLSVPTSSTYVQQLRQALSEAQKRNEDYEARLSRIHVESSVTGTMVAQSLFQHHSLDKDEQLVATSGAWESGSVQEFFDAHENISSSGESSEVSDEEEVSSDISDTENTAATNAEENLQMMDLQTGRRSKLPAPKPDTGDVSLWSLLCRNIGKDLSKISMPVTLNEPLNMLQRLCEELEYSELLDKAAETDDPYQRMVLVAAFSVSPYAATYYRAGQKPFNPLLGETYECIREDKGWSFVSEQVSHHPPISSCYCESKNFVFWQDIRIKSKFWGKSLEIQPVGIVNVKLPKYNEHYTWNKVTTCIHNLLGGQRWVDHYGEAVIENQTSGIKCKLTYAKSSYWSEKRHEVYGSITAPNDTVAHHLFGRWNEGIYCGNAPSAKCVWRPGSMPEDFEMYYGFTRFAIELNETDQDQVHLYPPTDTRFRTDQRLLEEGKIQEAENAKLHVEKQQRDRRKQREVDGSPYTPKWFLSPEQAETEVCSYTGKYWVKRKDPGFMKMTFPKLW